MPLAALGSLCLGTESPTLLAAHAISDLKLSKEEVRERAAQSTPAQKAFQQ